MFFCPSCHKAAPESSAFCPNCGAPLAAKSTSAPVDAAPSRPTPAYTAPTQPNPTYTAPAQPNPTYTAPSRPTYAAPAQPNPGYGAPAYAAYPGYAAKPAKKSSKGLIIGIVAAVLLVAIVIGVLFLTGVLGKPSIVGTWTGSLNLSQNMDVLLAEAPSNISSVINSAPGLLEALKTAPAIPVTYTFMEGGAYSMTVDMSVLVTWLKQNGATLIPIITRSMLGYEMTVADFESQVGMSFSDFVDEPLKGQNLSQTETGTYIVNGTNFTLGDGKQFGTFSRKELTLNLTTGGGSIVSLTLTRSK